MAATQSRMVALGTQAPDFDLPDVVSGRRVRLAALRAQPLLVMFLSRHCPYVQHVAAELARLGRDYQGSVEVVAISSNDAGAYPSDAPDRLREMARERGFPFPFCYDETQAVARAYGAECTPDYFLFDPARRLVYRGQLDGSRPGNAVVSDGRDLRAALDAVLAQEPVSDEQRPSLGCNIKWKR
ncbi:MAG TPA: thioredoxin family protein [Terriglobales bacterium]|nr:thioredoxin family protein [Terriglobales bacterium]